MNNNSNTEDYRKSNEEFNHEAATNPKGVTTTNAESHQADAAKMNKSISGEGQKMDSTSLKEFEEDRNSKNLQNMENDFDESYK
jgi:hypothetical protein